MTTKHFELGTEGMKELKAYLKKLKQDLSELPEEVVDTLIITTGEGEMNRVLNAITDTDGNKIGTVSRKLKASKGKANGRLSYGGLGAVYIEFGTGMVGKGSPHPMAGEVGWEYYIDTKYKDIRDGEYGWWHNREFHVGIPSHRIAYNAAKKMREDMYKIIQQEWRRINHD